MYYISRNIGHWWYGVVNTETDEETIMTAQEVFELRRNGDDVEKLYPMSGILVPYQPKETMTRKQIKAKMLMGLDVCVYKGIVSSIELPADRYETAHNKDDEDAPKPVEIRLSEFGTECGDYIISHRLDGRNHKLATKLVIILDDKCKVYKRSFRRKSMNGQPYPFLSPFVQYDIREVNNKTAFMLYRELYRGTLLDRPLRKQIVDHEWRKQIAVDIECLFWAVTWPYWLVTWVIRYALHL